MNDSGMPGMADPGEITPLMLHETFPGWRIFKSAGVWWAARPGVLVLDGPRSLLRLSLGAPDLAGLAEKLCTQARLDMLSPGELEAAWLGRALPAPPDVPLPMLIRDDPP